MMMVKKKQNKKNLCPLRYGLSKKKRLDIKLDVKKE